MSLRVVDGVVSDARVMVAAATEKLTRLAGAEAALEGGGADAAAFGRAAEAAAAEVETIGDARGSAAYKSELVRVYVRRALVQTMRPEAAR